MGNEQAPTHPLQYFQGRNCTFRYRATTDKIESCSGTIVCVGDGLIVVGHKFDTEIRLIPIVSLVDVNAVVDTPQAQWASLEAGRAN